MKICEIEKCHKKSKARNLCTGHYQKLTKYGDPRVVKKIRNMRINFIEENGCFVCVSHKKDKSGYPHIFRNKKHYLMHRFVYEQLFGEIPQNLVVRHKCDNPSCINPEHLELGTFLDNMKDRITRGRTAKGEQSGPSKLKENEVFEIRKMISQGKSLSEIANKFNISKSNVVDIRKRRSWKHLEEIPE